MNNTSEVSLNSFTLEGNVVDLFNYKIIPALLVVENGKIMYLKPTNKNYNNFILPGFIDAHIHIESSMLVPSAFAHIAVRHGTVATVSDPHEIANVLGIKGVKFMIADGKKVPFKFHFGAPSCVPATNFENAGAKITSSDIEALFETGDIKYLAEMMNWPGVIYDDAEVLEKISLSQKYGFPIDGHAPGLMGDQAKTYIDAGISTDHECFTYEEALNKLQHGMKIIIREGSAARNFDALIDLIDEHHDHIMFCSDDKHPNDLLVGHINQLAARAVKAGKDVMKVLRSCCINPVLHYDLPVGMLREGDHADFVIVNNLKDFEVSQTYINGIKVADNGSCLFNIKKCKPINNFNCSAKKPADFTILPKGNKIRVIEALDKQIVTTQTIADPLVINNNLVSDEKNDILKFTVVNRYKDAHPALAFIKNFGLKNAAIASSVGHDCHNITAVGTSDELICKAVNLLIESKGGLSFVSADDDYVVQLPVAGLMSDLPGEVIGEAYEIIDEKAKNAGSTLSAPFMTLSFMALLVIPDLKLSDLGLFDGKAFKFTDLFVNE